MSSTEYLQLRFRRPPGAAELFLVRHGESQPLVPDRPFDLVGGHGDPPLAPEGHEQAARVADRLAGEGLDAIYVTTLQRTLQTASPLAERLGLTPVVEADLREVNLGEWEGGLYRQRMAEGDPIALRVITEERWDVIPGAEPREAFSARVAAAMDRIAAAHPDQRVAVFSHGGVIGEVVRRAVAGTRGFAFVGSDNGAISHLVAMKDRWMVRRFNDTSHLHPHYDLDTAGDARSGDAPDAGGPGFSA